MEGLILAIVAGAVALAFAAYLAVRVLKADEGTERMQEIGAAIQEGANAFLKRCASRSSPTCGPRPPRAPA